MNLKFYQYIEGTPEEIYIALTNPFTILLWSGQPAEMNDQEGFEFSIFDGDICGKNLRMVPNQMIEQEWYFGDDNAQPSIATIKLHQHKSGTNVEVCHTNIPDDAFENIEEGWHEYYIGAVKHFFEDDGE
ncbi:MAG: SRPBCC domain-containing protein [Salinivirgaceae bacterium]|nr:SRPBCC domain-containing protein [Salinivirgaceae bacterium]